MNNTCKYCGKECKNENSHRNHERCCPANADRNYRNYSTGHKGANHFTKAKEQGLPPPPISEETREKWRVSSAGRRHSEESKKHLSEIAKKNHFGGHTSKQRIMYNGVQLHSSYETKLAIDLDTNSIAWTRPAPMHWLDDKGEDHRYYADFYLPDYDIYLDPKNDFLIEAINPAFGITDREKINRVAVQNNVRIFILNSEQLTWEAVKNIANVP